MRRLLLPLLLAITPAMAQTADPPDPYLWLEEVGGARAMDWVRGQNATSLGVLTADPHYQGFHDQALALAQAPDRIPAPTFLGGQVWNLWQDATHVQGIWRHASLPSYAGPSPEWQTALDLDALSKAESKHWVWKGVACFSPEDRRCLISLSDGGEDAVTTREFDTATAGFVEGGITIPSSKQVVDWLDADTAVVGTDWGADSLTASGYPYVIKTLHRGQALAAAIEIFRGTKEDVSVQVASFVDGAGHRATLLQRGLDFFRSEFRVVIPGGTRRLALPEKASLVGLVAGRLIVLTAEPFRPQTAGAEPIEAGSLVAIDPFHDNAQAELIFTPGPRRSVESAAVTRNVLIADVLDNVRGRAISFTPSPGGGWITRQLDLPDNVSIEIASASDRDDQVFLGVSGFLTPDTLYLADLASPAPPRIVKSLPAKFDASRHVVEQHEATSKDGTKIPYFVVRPRDARMDGGNPTLLYAYGGFQVSMLPSYSPALGKLWLERGGTYVLANIRGGGEFGPAWHEAGVKTHRQRIYDDFAAVAADLIASKLTSPRRLGIRGGSNGGLLMGVEFEQHPELWNAVLIEVPLLDMLRFERIAAGASWVGEYGSVKNPAERAFLAGISPYHNLKPGVRYPEPFIFTTTKDDRVGPVHARKFAARMAEMKLPYLYYEAIEGGHSAGANLQEAAKERALEMTYLARKLME